jgi:AraC-like DNA-binding protein
VRGPDAEWVAPSALFSDLEGHGTDPRALLGTQLSLSAVAREVGMSKHRLSHRFREVPGVRFRDYLCP